MEPVGFVRSVEKLYAEHGLAQNSVGRRSLRGGASRCDAVLFPEEEPVFVDQLRLS